MPINVSEALDSDTGVILTVERRTGSEYVDGLYVKGTTSTFKTIGSPQQPTSQDLQTLPEGDRDKDIFKFITKKPVRTASDTDGVDADIIIFKGIRFKIIAVQDWDTFGHTTSFGAKDQ